MVKKLNNKIKLIVVALSVSVSTVTYIGTNNYFKNKEIKTISIIANETNKNEDPLLKKELLMEAILLKIDGKEIGYIKNKEEINSVFNSLREDIMVKNKIKYLKEYSILNNVTYVDVKVPYNKISSLNQITEYIRKNKINESINFKLKGITEEECIIYPSVIINSSEDLLKGQSKVKSEGENGQKIIQREIQLENKKIINSKIINEKVIKSAENKIVINGTKEYKILPQSGLLFPSRGSITSYFGERWGKMHKGLDIGAPKGTPIYAADNGIVEFSGLEEGYGKVIKLMHDGKVETIYGHCSVIIAKEGSKIKKGEKIGEVGSTGNSTGPHLHFEVRVNGEVKNPLDYISK